MTGSASSPIERTRPEPGSPVMGMGGLKREQRAEYLVDAAIFLASVMSDLVMGQTLLMDRIASM